MQVAADADKCQSASSCTLLYLHYTTLKHVCARGTMGTRVLVPVDRRERARHSSSPQIGMGNRKVAPVAALRSTQPGDDNEKQNKSRSNFKPRRPSLPPGSLEQNLGNISLFVYSATMAMEIRNRNNRGSRGRFSAE